MPSPEYPQEPAGPEREPIPYHRAARFRLPYPAGVAYDKAQRLIYRSEDCDLSAFRFHVEKVWYVAVLGDEPPVSFRTKIDRILSSGARVSLPPQVLTFLHERRSEATKQGPWVERHY